MIDSPSGGAPEQAPRWDLVDTESYGGGIRFLSPFLIVWGYVGIYRRKEYVGVATWGPRGRGARPRGGTLHPHDCQGLFWSISDTPWASSGPKISSVKFQVNRTPFAFPFL